MNCDIKLIATVLKMSRLEEENSRLRSEIDMLSNRLKEIDRLKQLEEWVCLWQTCRI